MSIWLTGLIVAVSAIGLIVLVGIQYRFVTRRMTLISYNSFAALSDRESARIHALSEKKETFLKLTPKRFYYFPEDEVESLYAQVFRDVEQPIEILETSSATGKLGVGVSIGPVRPSIGAERGRALTIKYKPELNVHEMYNKIERVLIEKDRVGLGLEDFESGEESVDELLQDFKALCGELQVDLQDIERIEKAYLGKSNLEAAERCVRQVSQATGYQLMRGRFAVEMLGDGGWRLTFHHPLSDAFGKKVTISVKCGATGTTELGRQTFASFEHISVGLLVHVIGWDEETHTLNIDPIVAFAA